jgi:hypothetical protein
LVEARSYQDATGIAPSLKILNDWWMAAKNAKRQYPGVPPEFVDMVGDLRIPLDHPLDWQLVGDLARSLFEASLRNKMTHSDTADEHG